MTWLHLAGIALGVIVGVCAVVVFAFARLAAEIRWDDGASERDARGEQ